MFDGRLKALQWGSGATLPIDAVLRVCWSGMSSFNYFFFICELSDAPVLHPMVGSSSDVVRRYCKMGFEGAERNDANFDHT